MRCELVPEPPTVTRESGRLKNREPFVPPRTMRIVNRGHENPSLAGDWFDSRPISLSAAERCPSPCDERPPPLPIIGFAPQKVVRADQERPQGAGTKGDIENRRACDLPHIWTRQAPRRSLVGTDREASGIATRRNPQLTARSRFAALNPTPAIRRTRVCRATSDARTSDRVHASSS